jgi:hypothetical protein
MNHRYSPGRIYPLILATQELQSHAERYTMDATQYSRRQGILREINSVLERGQERTGEGFCRKMEPLVRELETLVRNVDETSGDRLERARNWRYLGNAYFDCGAGTDPARLEQAAEAYRCAEKLLVGIENPVELMKLCYSYGLALFGLSRRSNYWMVEESKHRYLRALEIAEKEMCEAVEPIRSALSAADQVIALLGKRKEIYRQISEIRHRGTKVEPDSEESQLLHPQEADLFERLIANYYEASQARPIPGAHQPVVDRLIRCM